MLIVADNGIMDTEDADRVHFRNNRSFPRLAMDKIVGSISGPLMLIHVV